MTMNAATGMNALHDLLAQVAALVKTERHLRWGQLLATRSHRFHRPWQCRSLRHGLLGQVALGNVDAVSGNPLRDAESLQSGRSHRACASLSPRPPQRGNLRCLHPKLVMRHESAVAADN